MNRVQKMNYVAQINPFRSVIKVMDTNLLLEDLILVGVKNVSQIPREFVNQLEETQQYRLHTLDAYAFGGRAIDLHIINPISGKFMTGSSSGTAVNVFLNINDIGIGVDGGGSVLAPAMALNLFGFISPLLAKEHMRKFLKVSTDGIKFTPSLGIMSRNFELLYKTIQFFLNLELKEESINVLKSHMDLVDYPFDTKEVIFPDIYGKREPLIAFLQLQLPLCDFMISYEGPVDVAGFGDSVFGHFDKQTKIIQKEAKKGLIRVANMSNATSIVIPDTKLGCAFVLLCESKADKISTMLKYAKKLIKPEDLLIKNYFRNHDLYFSKGYLE